MRCAVGWGDYQEILQHFISSARGKILGSDGLIQVISEMSAHIAYMFRYYTARRRPINLQVRMRECRRFITTQQLVCRALFLENE